MASAIHRTDPSDADIRLLISAPALGTVFEWYDFFICGTLVSIGGEPLADASPAGIDVALARAGYDLAPVRSSGRSLGVILFAIVVLGALSGATFGPVAALLAEMSPPAIRCSSLSIPYHLGTG
jgi:hypothetical protein